MTLNDIPCSIFLYNILSIFSLCFMFSSVWSNFYEFTRIVLFDVACQSSLNAHRLFNIPLALSLKYYFLNTCLVQICDKLFAKLNSNYHEIFWRNVDNRAAIECFPSSLFHATSLSSKSTGRILIPNKPFASNNLAP
jgi:hypothetical protein